MKTVILTSAVTDAKIEYFLYGECFNASVSNHEVRFF